MTTTAPTMVTPDKAFEMYRDLVENNEQAAPILLYASKEVLAPILLVGDFGDLSMAKVISRTIDGLKGQLGQAEWLIFSAESYIGVVESREALARVGPGDLARAFAAGDSAVRECANIVGVSADGTAWQLTVPFRRVITGNVEWGEGELHHGFRGPLVDTLLHAVR